MTPAEQPKRAPMSTAGIVVWRRPSMAGVGSDEIEILLVHPGGPFWAKKDEHAWSIPKGEFDPAGEAARDAAIREFVEELGQPVPPGDIVMLEPFRAGKKRLHAFAIEGDFDVDVIRAEDEHRSMVELEWPPRSGQTKHFPEVDRAEWVNLPNARQKLHKGQGPLVEQIRRMLAGF